MSNQSGSVEIPLSRPFKVGGADVTSLTMREPTVGDQLVAQAGGGTEAEHEVALLANLCSITPTELRAMPLRDYMRVKTEFMGFID
jgi:hypothetical protein